MVAKLLFSSKCTVANMEQLTNEKNEILSLNTDKVNVYNIQAQHTAILSV